jgi:hypothetical protein
MGTIKILENRLIIKKNGVVETYIKTYYLNSNSWIVYMGNIYELEKWEEEVE